MSDTSYSPDQPNDLVDRPNQRPPGAFPLTIPIDRLPRPPGAFPRTMMPGRTPPSQNYMQLIRPPGAPPPNTTVDGRPLEQPQQQPEQPYEPYIPSRADRPYHQWGSDDFAMAGARNYPGIAPGPYMPQARDLAGLIHGAVMGLGRFGSRYTGMPAIAMGTYASAYWKAYQAGMHQRAGNAYQQYRQARQMTIDRGKEEMAEYAKIYGQYHRDGKITDANGFQQALLDAARRYQNHSIINAIEAGDLPGAERILQATDAQVANLIKAQHQEERSRHRDDRLDAAEKRRQDEFEWRKKHTKDPNALPPEWGGSGTSDGAGTAGESDTEGDTEETPGTGGGGTEGGGDETEGGDEGADAGGGGGAPSEPETPALAKAPKSASPVRLAEADTGTRTDASGGGAPAAPRRATPEEVNQRIDDLAHGSLRGEPLPKGLPKPIEARISARQADLERGLNDIAASGATGDDMRQKLRAFDPSLAQTVDDITDGTISLPSTGGFGAAAGAGIRRLSALAKAVRPDWGPWISTYLKDFSNPNGAAQKTMQGAQSMTGAAKKVLQALQYIGEDETPPENFISQVISKNFTGDPRWANLGAALNSYVEESAKLARGGQSAEGDINRVLKEYAPIGMGPKSVRALLAVEAGVAVSKIQSLTDGWRQATGKNIPPLGYSERSVKYLEALDDLNMMTGQVDGKTFVPDDLRPLLGRAGSRRGEIDNPKPATTAPPSGGPTPEEVDRLKKFLEKNPGDPNRARIEELIKGR